MPRYFEWTSSVETVYVSHRPNTPRAERAEAAVAALAEKMGIEVIRLDLAGEPQADRSKRSAIAISLGGDGTLLRTRAKIGDNSVPLLSVNYGGLGALSELEAEELDRWLPKVLEGKFSVEERSLIETSGKTALNEVLVKSSEIGKSATITLRVDDHYLFKARADGAIVATPTGSSAYAFSAGGPLVDPSITAMVVVPIAPFFWGIRPFVLGDSVVQIAVAEPSTLVIDGEKVPGSVRQLSVKISKETAKFIRVRPFSFPRLYRKLESRLV